MQNLQRFILCTAGLVLLYSCDPCANLDCASNNYYGQFRIVSATNGNDLVFGSNKIYDRNTIKFYALKGADTAFFDFQIIKFPSTDYDSILYVRFFPKADTAFIQLSNRDIDTLKISYQTYQTRCCGIITEITNFKLNNSVDIPGDKGTQEIRK